MKSQPVSRSDESESIMIKQPLTAALISCPLVGQKRDPFSSIPSIPIALPYLAAFLTQIGVKVQCIDGFGENPRKISPYLNDFCLRGLTANEIVSRIKPETHIIGISVHSGSCHTISLDIIKQCKRRLPSATVIVGGHQATHLYRTFLDAGADFVVLGEGEPALEGLIHYLQGECELEAVRGIACADRVQPLKTPDPDINGLPYSSYECLPLENYWSLGFSHGPTRKGLKYLPLITSRGCPFHCHFCASSAFWMGRWRSRTPETVVDEISYYITTFNVKTFHIQDPNFATDKKRVKALCRLILQKNMTINWCLPSGIKLDMLDHKTLSVMKQAGCTYYNFSPEHASPKILEQMNKPINLSHMLELIAHSNRIGLKTGACFILGYADENEDDLLLLKKYVRKLVRMGLDEISYFIFCPVPGSHDFDNCRVGNYSYYEELCWSPRWRDDYQKLKEIRKKLYLDFLYTKAIYYPFRMLKSIMNLVTGNYELKSEMHIARYLRSLFTG